MAAGAARTNKSATVQPLFGGGFRNGPAEIAAGDEIGQADAGDEVEVILPRIVNLAVGTVLPPEAPSGGTTKPKLSLISRGPLFDILIT